MRLRLALRARREIQRASQWWDAHRPKAPDAFDVELREALALILAQPHIGQPVRHMQGVRRVILPRVHYFLYYRAADDELLVLALWHTSRGADPAL